MSRTLEKTKVLTIGYEGRSLDEFLDELHEAGVDRVVDVRELPLSRKKGFSKTSLSEALRERGIGYLHLRSLGNPKENRDRYRSGDVAGGAEIYRAHLQNGSRSTLLELLDELTDGRSCLLCFERDHAICHRDVIIKGLEAERQDLEVIHL